MGTMLDVALPESAYRQYREHLARITGLPLDLKEAEILNVVGAGLDAAVLDRLGECASLSVIIPPEPTTGRLDATQSFAAFEQSLVLALALAVFGSLDKASRWLGKPKNRFNGRSPVDVLSEDGAAHIVTMLVQISEGYGA